VTVRTLSQTFLLLALAAAAPVAARAAGTGAGLRFQKAVYSDAAEVALRNPEGVACDDRGAVVVADTGNARLLVFGWKDGLLEGGTQVKLSQLPYPVRVQIDSKGFVFALDRRARKIVKVDAKGAFAGYMEAQGVAGGMSPSAFRVGPSDDVYVLDVAAGKVLVLSPEGKVKRELPLPKAAGLTDVAVDSGGRVYLVDAVTAVVFAAEPGAKEFQALSKSLKEMVSFPTYVAPDNHGRLYVVDQNGNGVVKLGADGAYLGRELAIGSSEGALYYPAQLCVAGDGDLFVADRNNHRVQVFSLPR
jgi:DNA-binding beta-propeller fold protein YncE